MRRKARFSIAGIMLVVFLAALALAAFRYDSAAAAGGVYLIACGVMALAVVGAVCRDASERAWWLGFLLFGAGYLSLAFRLTESGWLPRSWPWGCRPRLPSSSVYYYFFESNGRTLKVEFPPVEPDGSRQGEWVAHCIAALLLAVLGGALAHFLFALRASSERATGPATSTPVAASRSEKRRVRPALLVSAVVIAGAVLAVSARFLPASLWVGACYLLTWGTMGLAVLGAIYAAGRTRAACVGAALFGAGFMLTIFGGGAEGWPARLATDHFLNELRPLFPPAVRIYPGASSTSAAGNTRALNALERAVPMHFPDETPLEKVLEYVSESMRDADGSSVPIYVDPVSLQEVEKTMTSPVSINLTGVPLRTSLNLVLRQLGLYYNVHDGMIQVEDTPFDDVEYLPTTVDVFLIVGHCVLALAAAGTGAVLALLITRGNGGSSSRTDKE